MSRALPLLGRSARVSLAALLILTAGVPCLGAFLLQTAPNARWDFLRTNLSVFPGTEKLFRPDSTLFWSLEPNLKNIKAAERLPDREYRFTVSTDGQGRRKMTEPRNSRHTVLFLGDSCTFGIPVNDNETFPALIQKRMKGVRCLNRGVPGYSAFQGRLLLEQVEAASAPDAVVITFWPNGRSVWDHLSDLEHEELLAAERAGEFSRHRLTRLLRRATPGDRLRLNDDEFADQIRRMIAWCRKQGSAPILQVWPSQRQMNEPEEIDRQELLRQIASQEQVKLVDLVPVFRERQGSSLFVDSVHATRQGYALVADTLRPVLAEVLAANAETMASEN